eukprot:GFUD01121657.1.p1 GENE.GFUD01121657.1~~GFUD01121657.1.p1  ORF type:complete len:337 (+),score=53.32 GFUD01121657.1:142-1152(+)
MSEQGIGGQYVPLLDTSDDEDEELFVNMNKELESKYTDYYQFIANSKSIRPICITEDVDFRNMSFVKKICWWVGTFFKLLSIIMLSVRTDRLSDVQYLRHHWLFYGGMLGFSLAAWSPQVIDTLGSNGILQEGIFRMDHAPAFAICAFGLFYYILSISFFFKYMGPWMREKFGTAKTLKFWEYFVSLAWQIQTIGFWVLTITPALFEKELEVIPGWLTTTSGILLVVLGIGSKMGAIYGTGYNTYYWYDMVTDIPNAYFVEVGIYKFIGSPTYTLGRGTSFGAALHFRSVPMLVAGVVDLVLINLFNKFVEQPSVDKMYSTPKQKEESYKSTHSNI